MNLSEFLNLSPSHTISFEDSKELHQEIALKGSSGLSRENSLRLYEYLEVCLLHQTVSPALRCKLQGICDELCGGDGGIYAR
jgi:hypothetical protein